MAQKIENLNDLLLTKLQTLYDMEQQIIQALPEMASAATDPELKTAFESHLEETKQQAERLTKAFEFLDAEPERMESDAVLGLIKDAQWCIENIKKAEVLDASLIAAAQFVEHFEMAGYGSARTWAEQLGETEVAEILQENMAEEQAADEKLSALAETKVNLLAMDEEQAEEVTGKKSFLGKMQTGNI